jgi:aerobic-type carbon monoxide dehydrogenase small subunit (CoxS/CutS family)
MASVTELRVNGTRHRVETDEARSLLGLLRDDLDLTGAKYGCGEGRCGACTVLIDGKAVRSCVTLVAACDGKEITTIEGLEKDGRLHPVQEAFLEVGAMQCGFCTPGMIMAGVGLLRKNPTPTHEDVCGSLEANVCRCGTYARISLAIRKAAEALKGGGK